LPKLTFVQLVEIQPDVCMRGDEQRRSDWHNRRQGLGSPEDRLLKEGSIGISCEKPTPNAGSRQLWSGQMMRWSDNLVRMRRCGAGIPMQLR